MTLIPEDPTCVGASCTPESGPIPTQPFGPTQIQDQVICNRAFQAKFYAAAPGMQQAEDLGGYFLQCINCE